MGYKVRGRRLCSAEKGRKKERARGRGKRYRRSDEHLYLSDGDLWQCLFMSGLFHSSLTPHSRPLSQAYGGDNGPYVYVDLGGKSSWDVFSEILEKAQIVTTPGAGFGPGGEGFLRLSAFASKENVDEACERLQKVMVK